MYENRDLKMKCPVCENQMEMGKLYGGYYTVKWLTDDAYSLISGGEKVDHRKKTEKWDPSYAIAFKCLNCKKIIIDF